MMVLAPSGVARVRRRWLAVVILGLWAPLPAHAGTPSLEDVLASIAPEGGRFESDYVQTRESGLLTEDVSVTGHIRYRSPGYLRKTEESASERRVVVIEDATVRVESDEATRSFALGRSRELELLMTLLEAVALGDAELLRKRFATTVNGVPDAWNLELESKEAVAGSTGKRSGDQESVRLRVSGDRERIERIELDPPDGSRVVLDLVGDGE